SRDAHPASDGSTTNPLTAGFVIEYYGTGTRVATIPTSAPAAKLRRREPSLYNRLPVNRQVSLDNRRGQTHVAAHQKRSDHHRIGSVCCGYFVRRRNHFGDRPQFDGAQRR